MKWSQIVLEKMGELLYRDGLTKQRSGKMLTGKG